METLEIKNEIESNSKQVYDMVNNIVGDKALDLDNYIEQVKIKFLQVDKVSDEDLNKIILQIPTHIYYLTTVLQDIDVRKGVSAESAKYKENESLLQVTGTVAEKQAKAANSTINDRIVQLAYKSSSSLIQSKINGAMEILSSAKQVQKQRLKEMELAKMAGNSVSF